MAVKIDGLILKGVGGIYTVLPDRKEEVPSSFLHADGTIDCRARGVLRHEKILPLVGDRVRLNLDTDFSIDSVYPRKNALIRPPIANLDFIFILLPPADPSPDLCYIDKLLCICEHNRIEPVIVVSKSDLAPQQAEKLCALYRQCGFFALCESKHSPQSIEALRDFICQHCSGKVSAFAGASGVGKSTLLNHLFPLFYAETGELSKKIGRGRHTTRHVELFLPTLPTELPSFFADTPGFTMLDFTRFDFLSIEDLPLAFRDFRPYLSECRYTDCTHTKETECGITQAVQNGTIPKSRHESFLKIREELQKKARNKF